MKNRSTPLTDADGEVLPLPPDFARRAVVRRQFLPVAIGPLASEIDRQAFAVLKAQAAKLRGEVRIRNPHAAEKSKRA